MWHGPAPKHDGTDYTLHAVLTSRPSRTYLDKELGGAPVAVRVTRRTGNKENARSNITTGGATHIHGWLSVANFLLIKFTAYATSPHSSLSENNAKYSQNLAATYIHTNKTFTAKIYIYADILRLLFPVFVFFMVGKLCSTWISLRV